VSLNSFLLFPLLLQERVRVRSAVKFKFFIHPSKNQKTLDNEV
jgi:hypothetical protein